MANLITRMTKHGDCISGDSVLSDAFYGDFAEKLAIRLSGVFMN